MWNDAKFRTLSDDAKLVWFLLMTHINQTMLGAMRASVGSLASDLGWPFERLLEAFEEVLATGMAKHDAEASFLWLPNFLRYNRPESPKVVKAWGHALEMLPECAMKTLVWSGCKRCVEEMGESFQEAFESLSDDYANTGAGTGTGTEEKKGDAVASPPPVFERKSKTTLKPELDEVLHATRTMLAELGVHVPPKLERHLADVTRLKAEKLKTTHAQAVKLIQRQAELARESGETVNRFWFEDAKWETQRAEPRKVLHAAQQAGEVVDELPEGLDSTVGRELWRKIRDAAAKEINRQSFETWLKPLRGLGVREGVLYVEIPSRAFQTATDRYSEVLAKLLPQGVETVKPLYLGRVA